MNRMVERCGDGYHEWELQVLNQEGNAIVGPMEWICKRCGGELGNCDLVGTLSWLVQRVGELEGKR